MVALYFIIIVSAIFLLCIISVISYPVSVCLVPGVLHLIDIFFFLLFLPSLFKICSSSGQYALPRHAVQLQGREHI
jgi:hypothetical protein